MTANGNISRPLGKMCEECGQSIGQNEYKWHGRGKHLSMKTTPRVNDTCHGTIGGFKSNGQRRHIKPEGNACATIPVTRSSIVLLNELLARYSIEWWNLNASTISLPKEKRQTRQVCEPCTICKCRGDTFQRKTFKLQNQEIHSEIATWTNHNLPT